MLSREAKTLGISPKAVLAFLFPVIGSIIASAVDWLNTGHFDVTTIRIAIAGLGASALAALGAYLGKPGTLVNLSAQPADAGTMSARTDVGPASDAVLARQLEDSAQLDEPPSSAQGPTISSTTGQQGAPQA